MVRGKEGEKERKERRREKPFRRSGVWDNAETLQYVLRSESC